MDENFVDLPEAPSDAPQAPKTPDLIAEMPAITVDGAPAGSVLDVARHFMAQKGISPAVQDTIATSSHIRGLFEEAMRAEKAVQALHPPPSPRRIDASAPYAQPKIPGLSAPTPLTPSPTHLTPSGVGQMEQLNANMTALTAAIEKLCSILGVK